MFAPPNFVTLTTSAGSAPRCVPERIYLPEGETRVRNFLPYPDLKEEEEKKKRRKGNEGTSEFLISFLCFVTLFFLRKCAVQK
jgi:hypothetical protein